MELILALAVGGSILLGISLFAGEPIDKSNCEKCSQPMEWFEGMGAGFYRCLKCNPWR